MTFASALVEARRARGLTQAALAGILDIDRVTLARWEAGSMKPSGGQLASLRTELGDELALAAIGEAVRGPGVESTLTRDDQGPYLVVSLVQAGK